MTQAEIRQALFQMRDAEYAAFEAKLIPNIPPETVIGVRTPALRSLAKQLAKEGNADAFLHALPHAFFEENQLHAFLIGEEKDFARCMEMTKAFLPHIDNWATCDQFSPKVFGKYPDELRQEILRWLNASHPYTVRFAVGMLMRYFLDARFSPEYPERVAAVCCEEYYVNMMAAWYFATALAKQYDAVIGYIEAHRLPVWVHNKTIQKCIESNRITPEQKQYLRAQKLPSAPEP